MRRRMRLAGSVTAVILLAPAFGACQQGDGDPARAASSGPTDVVPLVALADVIPAPVQAQPNGDDFVLGPDTVLRVAPAAEARAVAEQLAERLRAATGYRLPVEAAAAGPGAVSLLLDGADPRVGEQGYQLDVSGAGVSIRARTAAGLFAGAQTLRQLLPASIEDDRVREGPWPVAGGRIVDFPRFAYRGAMLDLARHFHTPDEVKAYIDHLALYKINHLHLHLSDDQGWRIQIDAWPRLATQGGGPGTGVGGAGPGFLTKEQYADLTAYAARRHITIVPEIDLPGHTNAALSSYAELNCNGVAPPPRTDTAVGYSSLCVGKEITYRFVEDVIRELAAMTPGPYLHIGGDEAQATTAAEYRAFMGRVLPMVDRYGKRPVGWHEIVNADPPATAVAQFWGTEPGDPDVAAAATRGVKVVMSPANRAYLDMKYDRNTRLGLDWAGFIEVRDAYDWDPGTRVQGVAERSVAGVEAPLWSETLRTLDDIEFMAFPRLPAIAEVGWSPRAGHDWESFRRRLAGHGERWQHRGIDFHRSPQVPWP